MSSAPTQWGAYARIADALRTRLADVSPGSPVPSEASLASEFSVARNTVRRALAELAREGLIGTVPGRGRVRLPAEGDAVPAYRRIAAELRRGIAGGSPAAGQPLPSEAALTREYGVSRGTVRQALSLLGSLGVVRSEHGRGWFVEAVLPVDGG